MISGQRRNRTHGFTLVEILVALTLLLIGIYAAMRIFPVGFRVTESSQNRVWAANLARAELERVKLAGGSLPDAIIITDPFGQYVDPGVFDLNTIGGYDPYELTPRVQPSRENDEILGLLVTNPGWEPDGVYLPRMIIGETVTIPFVEAGKQTRGWLVPIHLLNFAPIDHLHYDSAGEPTGDPIQVRSTLYQPVNDLVFLADLPLGSHHYYLDYENKVIYFRVGEKPRRVAIDYTYLDSDGNSHNVLLLGPIEDDLTRPAPGKYWTSPIPLPKPDTWPDIARVLPGRAQVYEVFEFMGFGGTPADLETNQFAMSSLDSAGNLDVAGRIYFSTDDAGRTVKIDYRVRDWGIVREDRRIERDNTTLKVTLAVPFIAADKTYASQPREDNPVAIDPADGRPAYAVAIRLSDGNLFYPDYRDPDDPGQLIQKDFAVDSRKGELAFHDSEEAPSGTEVRILYRTENHWTVQVMKPAAVYYRDPVTGGEAWPGFQYFLWGIDNDGIGQDLYFSPEYADMMVTADYQGEDPDRSVFGELHQIALVEVAPERVLGKISLNYAPVPDSFITVRGASVRVRTLWTERGSAQAKVDLLTDLESATPEPLSGRYLAEAWRAVNLDTQLTKAVAWGGMP